MDTTAADGLSPDNINSQFATIALTLSERPSRYWVDLFYTLWAQKLKADVIELGEFAEGKNLTQKERDAFRAAAYDLNARIHSPSESCAPAFVHPAPANSAEPSRIAWQLGWVGLYNGLEKYTARVREVVQATNEQISIYPPAIAFREVAEKEARDAESRAAKVTKIIEIVASVIEDRPSSLLDELALQEKQSADDRILAQRANEVAVRARKAKVTPQFAGDNLVFMPAK
jgi:hypothetical protein